MRSASAGEQAADWRSLPIRDQRVAAWFSVGLVLLALSPIVRNCQEEPQDGFPLSHFPMFSMRRGEDLAVTHFVGLTADGQRRNLPFAYFGTRGLNTARKQIRRIVREGGAEALCAHVTRRLANEPHIYGDVKTVRVVTADYEYDRFFQGDVTPVRETVHASCGLPQ